MTVALTILETDARAETAIDAVILAGRYAAERHWVPATSGNFSVRIDSERIAITRSGVDKGALARADVLIQKLDAPLVAGSSAEAALHTRHYVEQPDTGAIFHIHGPHSTVIGLAHAAGGAVRLDGWELQKALSGVKSHETTIEVPIFANDQDIDALSDRVAAYLSTPLKSDAVRAPGYLLAGHGLYAWGKTAQDARRHIEALETLFQQSMMLRSYRP